MVDRVTLARTPRAMDGAERSKLALPLHAVAEPVVDLPAQLHVRGDDLIQLR